MNIYQLKERHMEMILLDGQILIIQMEFYISEVKLMIQNHMEM
jgi:hypothetical protein